ncbi:dihydrofolate reductase family protein [Actinoplanes sp. NPDC049265]|uniref:dihydrofolate reductase family protein n=1 Tax=Actinoplanes sp. NPDC049265 TaxID=3363902 RepID=UPI0037203B2F
MSGITVVNFVTLDGVVQSPLYADEDTDGGFERGGWVQPSMDPVVGRVMGDATTGAGGFLFGRRTYETFVSNWSEADQSEPAVAALNRRPKYVVSRTLDKAEWHNSQIVREDEIAGLGQREDLVVFGSSGLIPTLVAQDLIDRYTLLVFPVVVGGGKRMFPDGGAPATLTLDGSETSTTGVIILSYSRPRGR